ncbi:MAG: hypothetical protein ACOCZQ_00700 [Nanoarchaeota archaeon]
MKGANIFVSVVAVFYLLFFFFDHGSALKAVQETLKMFWRVIPALVFVMIVMFLLNLYVTPEKIRALLGNTTGLKKWSISIVSGVLSMGPIYMWYPILRDLEKKGATRGFLAAFLYGRSVKPFLMPMMVFYFGILFTVLWTFFILITAYLQGLLFDRLRL